MGGRRLAVRRRAALRDEGRCGWEATQNRIRSLAPPPAPASIIAPRQLSVIAFDLVQMLDMNCLLRCASGALNIPRLRFHPERKNLGWPAFRRR